MMPLLKTTHCLIALALLTPLISAAHSDDGEKFIQNDLAWFRVSKGSKVRVSVRDSVVDGCWKDSKASTSAASIELVRSGLEIDDKSFNTLYVDLVGYKLGNGICIAHLQFSFAVLGFERRYGDGTVAVKFLQNFPSRYLFERGVILSGLTDLSDRISDQVTNYTRELLVEAASNQAAIRKEINNWDVESARFWLDKLEINEK